MAYRVVSTNSTFSTATPDYVPNTPTIHASTNITVSTTSLYTATYTGTAGNQVTGCMIFIAASGTGGSISITHQEDSGAGFADTAATASINITTLSNLGWYYWRFGSAFTYTTSTANKQRFRIVASSPTGTTTAVADSGGANIMFFATDVNATTIQTTEDVFVINQNGAGTVAFTVDGTQTIGTGTTTTLAASRQIGNALTIGVGATVQADTVASVSLTVKGNTVVFPTGSFLVGSSGTAYPSANTFTFTFNQNGASVNYGACVLNGGIWKTYGTPKSSTTLWKAHLSSGTGTAASPAIMDAAVDWSVGDRIQISPTSNNAANYNETEYRYIITKNSATSYVWSSSAGGAETALVNAHSTDAWCLNITRNVVFTTSNTAHAFYFLNYSTTAGNVVHKWTSYNTVGGTAKSFVGGFYVDFTTSTTAALEYCVLTNQLYQGFIFRGSRISETFTGNIVADGGALSTTGGAFYPTSAGNKNFVDCFVVDNERSAVFFESVSSLMFTRFYAIGCNQDGGSDAGTFYNSNAYNITMIDCEVHCNRTYGFSMGASDYKFYNCLFGTKGTNTTADIFVSTDGYTKGVFFNCNFGSATRVSNYLNMSDGAELAMDTVNDTTNNHIWYTNRGTGRSTGSGLADTTVRTAGTLNVGIYAESSSGFQYEFQVLARPATYVQIGGFVYENATFVADGSASVVVELFLPGSTTADDTDTMTKTASSTDNNAVFSVQAYYSGTVNRYATVRITVVTTTSGAYAYVADIFNGTNNITNLLTWKDGKPSDIMFEQLGDAQAVWQVANSTLTTLGTTGYNQAFQKILTGRATGGGNTSITISAAGSATDQTYYENIMTITSGTGAGQSRIIVDYNGGTKVAYVDREWEVNPDSDSFFAITPFSGIFLANAGKCPLDGGNDYIYFNSFASTLNDSYVDSSVYISAGLGAGQIRLITDYDGFTKSATVNTAWSVNPDSTSVYKVIPAGNTVTGSLTPAAILQVQNGILGEQLNRGGTWDVNDSLAMRLIDVDLKTDDINVEVKNMPTYLD